jgi:hypothetical protein
MTQPIGRSLSLSLARRLICDLMHRSRHVPLIPMERRMRLAEVAEARLAAQPRPSWCAIVLKAYGIVAAAQPRLRRAYLGIPWPHLYEHPQNLAMVAVERLLGDEEGVLFTQVRGPENQTLSALDRYLRRCKEDPVENNGYYRRQLLVSSLPRPLRRFVWWFGLELSGYRRAKRSGTFGLSVTAGSGAGALQLVSPLTTALHYGVLEADGTLELRLTFDHRVLDAATVARAMTDMEHVLNGAILRELRYLRAADAA